MERPSRIERVARVFASHAEADAETRRQYRAMTPDERVAITVALQRRYYQQHGGAERRLQRVLAVRERA